MQHQLLNVSRQVKSLTLIHIPRTSSSSLINQFFCQTLLFILHQTVPGFRDGGRVLEVDELGSIGSDNNVVSTKIAVDNEVVQLLKSSDALPIGPQHLQRDRPPTRPGTQRRDLDALRKRIR